MKAIRKKIILLSMLLLAILLVMMPNRAFAYDFYCTDPNGCYKGGKPSVSGIFHQMIKNPMAWLDSTPVLGGGFLGEGKFGTCKWEGATIRNTGAVCVGHNYTGGGRDAYNFIGAVITVDANNKNLNEQLLGYAAYRSTAAGETSSDSNYKSQIRKWVADNYTGYPYYGIVQNSDSGKTYDYATPEASQYAHNIINEAFRTNSRETEGARQTIEIKSYNGENYTFIGPYHLNATYGTMKGGTVVTREGKTFNVELCSGNGTTPTAISNASGYNGNDFYVVVKGTEVDSVQKIILNKELNVVRARIVIAETGLKEGQYTSVYYGTEIPSIKSMELPGVPFSTIKIKKVDTDTRMPLKNVGFVVYNETYGKWVKDGVPSQLVDRKDATIYQTNGTGDITIRNLKQKGNFKIYEVINPHFGYLEASEDRPSQTIDVEITAVGQNFNKTIENKRIYVKLSGYVWEDKADASKESIINGLYDENGIDQRLNNVTVILRKANGEEIDRKMTDTIINTKGETERGAYIFGDYQRDPTTKRIEIEDLRGARIEFVYNGMCYQSVPVNASQEVGSKATDALLRPKFNQDYATITKGKAQNGNYNLNYRNENHEATLLYGGNYLYGYDGQKYPISGIDEQYLLTSNTWDATSDVLLGQMVHTIDSIYRNQTEEIPNINLGVIEREMPDISVVQDVESAQIGLNGYWHTYHYSERFSKLNQEINKFLAEHPDSNEMFNIGVNFGEKYGPPGYTTTVYASDTAYKAVGEKGDLDIYVTYKVKITNESSTIHTRINQLHNYFDPDYKVISITDQNGNEVPYQEDGQINGYSRVLIQPTEGINLEHNKEQYFSITYRLNDDAVIGILNQDKTLESATEIASYSSFDDAEFTNSYAGIDRDSAADDSDIGNKETYQDDIDQAPSLTLTSKNTRVIKGTVWHENAIQELLQKQGFDKERLGNGQYEETLEDVIKDVKVELLKQDDDGNFVPTKLYQKTASGAEAIEIASREIHTNEKGEYSFVGVIPGKYVVRFTYKNDSVICNVNGTQGKTLKEAEGGVEYYKSTTYRTTVDRNRNVNRSAYPKAQTNLYWYADETKSANGIRLSDAKDNEDLTNKRTSETNINYGVVMNSDIYGLEKVVSETSQFEIRMDCNADDIANITKDTSQYGQTLRFEFDNIDLGIIRRPRQDLILRKEVSYVEVALTNGQVIIRGDPRKEDIPFVKFLPDGNVHIEIDQEIIQGATLKLDYEIIVDNTQCEIDYNNTDYYYFASVPAGNADWKIAIVTDLFDYPSKDLRYNQDINDSGWKKLIVTNLEPERLASGIKEVLKEYTVLLHTEDFSDMKPGETKQKKMTLTRVLSNTNGELSFDNDVEINAYYGRKMDYTVPGNYDPTDSSTSENDDDVKNVVITGPTGENQNYLPYVILGVISSIILLGGIILIKKKVLK